MKDEYGLPDWIRSLDSRRVLAIDSRTPRAGPTEAFERPVGPVTRTSVAAVATNIHSPAEYACDRKNPATKQPASAVRSARA
jgi:hypothetical protein